MSNDKVAKGGYAAAWMQPVDKIMLATGILWSLFTLYGIGLLLPRVERRLWSAQIKLKGGHANLVAPSRLQRVVFIVLTCVMTAVAFAAAFHRDLATVIG